MREGWMELVVVVVGDADQARGQRACTFIGCCNRADEGKEEGAEGDEGAHNAGDERLCSKVMFHVRAVGEHVW